MNPKPIYFMEIEIAYKKGKSLIKSDTWCVTTYQTPSDISRHDRKTMSRLNQLYYSKGYKSTKQIVILNIKSKKQVGTTTKATNGNIN